MCSERSFPPLSVISIDTLTGPASEAMVPRERRFDVPAWQRPQKPLWTWDQAVEAIDAFQDAGAAVVEGELVVASDDGVRRLPWEPWLTGARIPSEPPPTRSWWIPREAGEPWMDFVARAAAYARIRMRELAGEARTTPAGAIHVDLAWTMEEELALWDVPAWIRQERRRLVEQGGPARGWYGRVSMRVRCAGQPVPGSYFGFTSEDMAGIPDDARYARVRARGRNLARLAELGALEVLWAASPGDRALGEIGRLSGLRELFLLDEARMRSLEPLTGLDRLAFAKIAPEAHPIDPRPLERLPALRYLYLHAERLRDLSALSDLTQLSSLHVTPRSVVDSVAPLAALTCLRYLSVWADFVRDGSAAPLAALQGLRGLETTLGLFSVEELARLSVALPRTEGDLRSPFLPPDDWIYNEPCWRCSRPALVTSAGRKRILCPECDADAVRQHVIRWEVARSAAAATRAASSSAG